MKSVNSRLHIAVTTIMFGMILAMSVPYNRLKTRIDNLEEYSDSLKYELISTQVLNDLSLAIHEKKIAIDRSLVEIALRNQNLTPELMEVIAIKNYNENEDVYKGSDDIKAILNGNLTFNEAVELRFKNTISK